eukprot:jgi/Ulvmu1/1131/UM107_0004.1
MTSLFTPESQHNCSSNSPPPPPRDSESGCRQGDSLQLTAYACLHLLSSPRRRYCIPVLRPGLHRQVASQQVAGGIALTGDTAAATAAGAGTDTGASSTWLTPSLPIFSFNVASFHTQPSTPDKHCFALAQAPATLPVMNSKQLPWHSRAMATHQQAQQLPAEPSYQQSPCHGRDSAMLPALL